METCLRRVDGILVSNASNLVHKWNLISLSMVAFIFQVFPKFLAIRDIGFQEIQTCKNTIPGRYVLSDDSGYVCDALSLDPHTRCCPRRGDKFSCFGCNLLSHCCNSYEFCVSCCLHPDRTPKAEVVKVKIAKPVTSENYKDVFDFCAGRCRHSSESVVHENAYNSDFHHCFTLPPSPPVHQLSHLNPLQ